MEDNIALPEQYLWKDGRHTFDTTTQHLRSLLNNNGGFCMLVWQNGRSTHCGTCNLISCGARSGNHFCPRRRHVLLGRSSTMHLQLTNGEITINERHLGRDIVKIEDQGYQRILTMLCGDVLKLRRSWLGWKGWQPSHLRTQMYLSIDLMECQALIGEPLGVHVSQRNGGLR